MIKQHASIRRTLSHDPAESLPPPELIGREVEVYRNLHAKWPCRRGATRTG